MYVARDDSGFQLAFLVSLNTKLKPTAGHQANSVVQGWVEILLWRSQASPHHLINVGFTLASIWYLRKRNV